MTNHPIFQRDGPNILLDVKIPLNVALFGGFVKIPTIDGDVELKVQAGTQPDERQLMRKKGIRKVRGTSGDRGDQIITYKVSIPKALTERQMALLKEALEGGGGSSSEANPSRNENNNSSGSSNGGGEGEVGGTGRKGRSGSDSNSAASSSENSNTSEEESKGGLWGRLFKKPFCETDEKKTAAN